MRNFLRPPASRTAAFACLAALAAASHPSLAIAESKTSFQVLVASVSTRGKEVDPALKHMEQDFKRNGLSFTSFKLEGRASMTLAPGQSDSVRLPNGTAQVTVLRTEGRAVRIKVAAPFSTSEYTMTPGGEVYIDAGARGAQKVFLAVKR